MLTFSVGLARDRWPVTSNSGVALAPPSATLIWLPWLKLKVPNFSVCPCTPSKVPPPRTVALWPTVPVPVILPPASTVTSPPSVVFTASVPPRTAVVPVKAPLLPLSVVTPVPVLTRFPVPLSCPERVSG
ncbi:hypothetical protein D3C85_1244180 [compost metagenome]